LDAIFEAKKAMKFHIQGILGFESSIDITKGSQLDVSENTFFPGISPKRENDGQMMTMTIHRILGVVPQSFRTASFYGLRLCLQANRLRVICRRSNASTQRNVMQHQHMQVIFDVVSAVVSDLGAIRQSFWAHPNFAQAAALVGDALTHRNSFK